MDWPLKRYRVFSAHGFAGFYRPRTRYFNGRHQPQRSALGGRASLACQQCVIIELSKGPNLRESRRLQIAAEEGGGVGLILIHGRAHTSASETRWHCIAQNKGPNAWGLSLTKNRKGELGQWDVRWTPRAMSAEQDCGGAYEAGVIHLVAATAA
jgi:hypothetical protein